MIAVGVVLGVGAVVLYLAIFTYENGCDDRCVAESRSEAYEGASWRLIEDSWQWTAGLAIASLAFAALVAWATALVSRRTRLATPLFATSLVLFCLWAVAF
jgi:hypothetical protein